MFTLRLHLTVGVHILGSVINDIACIIKEVANAHKDSGVETSVDILNGFLGRGIVAARRIMQMLHTTIPITERIAVQESELSL